MSQKVGHRGTMSVYDQCSMVSFLAYLTACNDKRKMRRKENVSSTLPRTKIGYSKESNDQRDQKRIHFTSNPCEDELLVVGLFPARFAHARYGSRMIDRFLNWGDHGKPKSGKIKGRCQPPLLQTHEISKKIVFFYPNNVDR